VPEPVGGAAPRLDGAAARCAWCCARRLAELKAKPREALITERYEKFGGWAAFEEASVPSAAGDQKPRSLAAQQREGRVLGR